MKSSLRSFLLPFSGSMLADSLSGLTVSLALIPEAIAFSLVAGVSPAVGLYAAFFMCLITTLLGGRPGMISGATGSMAVVMVAVVKLHGLPMLMATVIVTGVLQLLAGALRLGKLISLMPKPVMVGFVNGLAIVIAVAQLGQFQTVGADGHLHFLQGGAMYTMLLVVSLAMAITFFLPRYVKVLPSALVAIVFVSLLGAVLRLDLRVVNDMMQGATDLHFPHFSLPNVSYSLHTLRVCLPYSLILAVIGLSESLMTLSLINQRTRTTGASNQECVAQGLGNMVSGCFGAMGGCAMIGQSMINITSGGRGRLSGLVAAAALLLNMLFGWSLIKEIPLAALVGVMFIVVIKTFDWSSVSLWRKIPRQDLVIILTVTTVTVLTDLATAVCIGIIIAALVFAWESAKNIYVIRRQLVSGDTLYELHGPLFFASTTRFLGLFTVDEDEKNVIIDCQHAQIYDHSAIEAITYLAKRYADTGRCLHFRGMNEACAAKLGRVTQLVPVRHKKASHWMLA